ncbi:GNAT family N-acetyltransferase [Gammaproteobacteria bacterium]|nr:GNAT family N-acetyltransferase [Gammaproteobacteria bacterium]
MKNSFINSIDKISNQDYKNILKDDDSPLISHEFLNALEASGSAIQGNGWQPMHLILEDNSNLSGFLPLYLKNNSHGEFVFDHLFCIFPNHLFLRKSHYLHKTFY